MRTDLECSGLMGGALAPTGFDLAEDDVPAPFEPVPSPAELCDGLVDPGDCAKVDLEPRGGDDCSGDRVRRLVRRVGYLPVAADGVRLRRRYRRGIVGAISRGPGLRRVPQGAR